MMIVTTAMIWTMLSLKVREGSCAGRARRRHVCHNDAGDLGCDMNHDPGYPGSTNRLVSVIATATFTKTFLQIPIAGKKKRVRQLSLS